MMSAADRERMSEEQALLEALGQTLAAMGNARRLFAAADDEDLLEAYAYELKALEARHRYLLRRTRALECRRLPTLRR